MFMNSFQMIHLTDSKSSVTSYCQEDPLLQGIFPTQGLNPGLLRCRWILYQLSYQGSPRILEWAAYPFSSRSSLPRNWIRVSCIAGRFFTNWAIIHTTCKYFLPFSRLSFHFANGSLCCAKALKFNQIPFAYFCFYFFCLLRDKDKQKNFDLCQRVFDSYSLLWISWFQVLYLCLWSIYFCIWCKEIF